VTGFDVRLRQKRDDPTRAIPLVEWDAAHLEWIDEFVEQGQAELVVDHGGYPYIYELSARHILAWFAPDARDALAQRLNCKVWRGDWNVLFGVGSLHEVELAACSGDAILQMEVWDQS